MALPAAGIRSAGAISTKSWYSGSRRRWRSGRRHGGNRTAQLPRPQYGKSVGPGQAGDGWDGRPRNGSALAHLAITRRAFGGVARRRRDSPYLATATALQSSNAAIGNALSSGRAVAAVGALTHTPGNAVRAILDGQETTSESLAIQAGSGINVPVAGLLGPASEDEV